MRGAVDIDAMLVVVAVLYVRPGAEEVFADFEEQALAILHEHGGRLERAVRPVCAADAPHEIHVLTFPSQSVFDAYRGDPRLAALASPRQSAVEKTVLWSGPDVSVEYRGE
jgi:uncharacterized protein (DUF1330 family)